jgi:hypothetical protein
MTRWILGTMMVAALASSAWAQAQPGSEIQVRKNIQQDRIASGVASGELTAGETLNLEMKEAAINQEIRNDRQDNGGPLTPEQKQQINQQQNALSKQIYQEKHDAATQPYGNNEVDQRRKAQQQRIASGIQSGQLTAGEAARLENQQRKINQEVRTERSANGGNLTKQQKAQVNRQLNQTSARIYNRKHNAARAAH